MPPRVVTFGLTPALQRVMRFARLIPDRVNRAAETLHCPAGKAINAARAARLFAPGADPGVIAVAPLGGPSGDAAESDLRTLGIEVRRVDPGHHLRVCVTVLDDAAGTVTELVQETPPMLPELADELLGLVPPDGGPADVLVCSGTLAPGVAEDAYARAVIAFAGETAIVDAKGPPLIAALAAPRPFHARRVAKLNFEELEQTVGSRDLAALHRLGATHCIVTDGPHRVLVSDGHGVQTLTPPEVRRVNTTGCGDCLAGVLAAQLALGGDFFGAARTAVAAASASAEHLLPAVFEPHRLRELLDRLR